MAGQLKGLNLLTDKRSEGGMVWCEFLGLMLGLMKHGAFFSIRSFVFVY